MEISIPETVSNLDRSLLNTLYLKEILENMELNAKVKELTGELKSTKRKLGRSKQ